MSVTVYYGCLTPKEGSVMKNTSISLFRQILDLVPKHEFEKIIMKHKVTSINRRLIVGRTLFQ